MCHIFQLRSSFYRCSCCLLFEAEYAHTNKLANGTRLRLPSSGIMYTNLTNIESNLVHCSRHTHTQNIVSTEMVYKTENLTTYLMASHMEHRMRIKETTRLVGILTNMRCFSFKCKSTRMKQVQRDVHFIRFYKLSEVLCRVNKKKNTFVLLLIGFLTR